MKINIFAQQPKIGLVLSGGGAKGLAHIGVLRVLEEAGIKPDYITGTSMGSIVGGLYAIGYSVDELDSIVTSLDWGSYFNDGMDRSLLPVEEKKQAERYLVSLDIVDGKLQAPKGLVKGKKLALLLSHLTMPAHSMEDFEQFPIPFHCIATDLETGKAVVLKNGRLAEALRASMSIPSVFHPFELDGKLLIDGGVARNFPVEDARAMGADIIIGVDVGAPLYAKDELTSIVNIMDQTSSFRIVESNDAQRKLADLVITPDLSGYTSSDFEAADSLIARGEVSARKALPEIKALMLKSGTSRTVRPMAEETKYTYHLTGIEVIGLDQRGKEGLKDIIAIKLPKTYSLKHIEEKILHLLATDFYDKLDYCIRREGEDHKLIIWATAAARTQIQLGVNYDSNFKAALLLNTTRHKFLLRSDRLSLDLRVSEFPGALIDYIVHTRSRPNIGLKLSGKFNLYPGHFYKKGKLANEFNLRTLSSEFALFSGFSNQLAISLGVRWAEHSQNKRFFDFDNESLRLRQRSVFFELYHDSRDREDFPSRGTLLDFENQLTLSSSLRTRDSTGVSTIYPSHLQLLLKFQQVIPISHKLSLLWFAQAGLVVDTTLNLLSSLYLGRSSPFRNNQVEFYGFQYMQQPAGAFAFSGLKIRFEVGEDKYINLIGNYGTFRVTSFSLSGGDIFASNGIIGGAALELGAVTFVGPVSFTVEKNTYAESDFNFSFRLGYRF